MDSRAIDGHLVHIIDAATTLSDDDRQWLHDQREDLEHRWTNRPVGLPDCVVHGDAWVGNIVTTSAGLVLLDFGRFPPGPPEWDLVSTAVKLTTTGAVSGEDYTLFCDVYGADVTQWDG